MSIALCTDSTRCTALEHAQNFSAQLAADLTAACAELRRTKAELTEARAQLATAQQQLEAAQAAYQQAKADAAFHMAGFVDECKRKAAQ